MHRQPLRETLRAYRERWESWDGRHETPTLERFETFLESTPDCFLRSHAPGHFTGSALIWCPATRRVLLTHHRKLGKWLQLGGHADGHPLLHEVAMQEAREESGLEQLRLCSEVPFDLDVHEIPDGPHDHYDARYLVEADSAHRIVISPESHDLRWVSLSQARGLCLESSMLRQFDKLEALT